MRGLTLLVSLSLALPGARASAQGVTLDHYRAAETPRDGFALARPRSLGHLGFAASLHLDYALAPLRAQTAGARAPVDHQLVGQVGVALGAFDRLVVALRLPVSLVLDGGAAMVGPPAARDPAASGAGLGDLALTLRYRVVGDDADAFALAIQTEATAPIAEAASPSQDLAGEAGVSFTPELLAEVRFAPVRITASAGARFREAAVYRALRVQHELTWGLAIGVDIVPDVLDAMLEGFGATPLDRFGEARASPVELLLGARVRPVAPLYLGLAGGLGLGDGYGAPVFRGVFTIGYADAEALPITEAEPDDIARDAPREDEAAIGRAEAERAEVERARAEREERERWRVPPATRPEYGQLDRDGDHIFDADDRCVLDREDFDEIMDGDGCPEEDADADAVADVVDICPTTPGVESADPATRGCPARAFVSDTGSIVITERVEFATGSDRILPESEGVLGDVLSILLSSESVRTVRVEGHTDDRGRDDANMRLSTARAASVRRWLVERGVDVARLRAWGCGEVHPLAPNRRRADRQRNRRVEFLILDPRPAELAPLREGCEEAP